MALSQQEYRDYEIDDIPIVLPAQHFLSLGRPDVIFGGVAGVPDTTTVRFVFAFADDENDECSCIISLFLFSLLHMISIWTIEPDFCLHNHPYSGCPLNGNIGKKFSTFVEMESCNLQKSHL
jgi:hypothetical protein